MSLLLTIALLTKNSEKTLRYVLTSVARQKLPEDLELEVIVVDGYSRDRTLDILRQYIPKLRQSFGKHLQKTLIVREKVNTIGFARNLALKLAKGDWILWLDSDNVLSSNYLFKALKSIKSQSKKTMVIYPKHVIPLYDTRSFIQKTIALYLSSCTKVRAANLSVPFQNLRYTAMQGTLCHTECLREIGGFNSLLLAAEDINVFMSLMSKGYTMESFDGTLYFFVRSDLRSWFKQAMYWDYGKYMLYQLYQKDLFKVMSINTIDVYYRKKSMVIVNMLKEAFKCLNSAAHTSNNVLSILLTLLLYVYRRLGYYTGQRLAQKRLMKRS